MSGTVFDTIDIHQLERTIKEKNKLLSKEDIENLVYSTFSNGVQFKNCFLTILAKEYDNKFTHTKGFHYFFRCPKCDSKVRKILSMPSTGLVACRGCCKIKTKMKINSQVDRILKIQTYMTQLVSCENLTHKKKRQLSKFIVDHYNKLDDRYKFAYNTFIFKELQNWCADKLVDKSKSKDYKEAARDMLDILKDSKNILIKTGLAKPSKRKLYI